MAASAERPLRDILVLVVVLWAIFLIQVVAARTLGVDLAAWGGVRPRELPGLVGVITSHVLHADLAHLVANSLGLLVLGFVTAGANRSLTGIAITLAALVAGLTAWVFGGAGTAHIGASGIVFGLLGFLVANGLFRRGCLPLVIAAGIVLSFGSAAISGLIPQEGISWQMHAGGAGGGIIASWLLRRQSA
jgi:membrane associated rhomboid family serine protease